VGGFTSPGLQEKQSLLQSIGVTRFSDLLAGIPPHLRENQDLNLPPGVSEFEAGQILAALAGQNGPAQGWNVFLGGGAYDHFIPSATPAVLSRSEFLTAYTPYQAEVSQGTLQACYEYQSMICELTGMEVSNASLYDGATALAEAMLMARAVQKKGTQFIVPKSLNVFYQQVLKTYARGLGIELVEADYTQAGTLDLESLAARLNDSVFGVAVQSPNFFGVVEDIAAVARLKEKHPFTLVAAPSLLSLGVLEAPGLLGADICAGEAHYFASPPGFGGPLLGFLAARRKNVRQMPGRIIGRTLDAAGRPGFVLTAQTREQHIRREKATSNICTSEALLAMGAAVTLSLLGKEGLADMAMLNVRKTQYALSALRKCPGVAFPFSGPVFNEFVVEVRDNGLDRVFEKAAKARIMPGFRLERADPAFSGRLLVSITEKKGRESIDALVSCFM
jgi:glycine dehydrogenase subunit 1